MRLGRSSRNRPQNQLPSSGPELEGVRYNRLVAEEQAMRPASDRVKLTYEDLLALPDDGMRHELIDGEHYVTPAPTPPHQFIIGNLYLLIGNYLRERRLGVVAFAPFDVVFSRYDVVEPDLIYFSTARFKEVVGDKNAQGAPDLAIEILSPSTRRRDEIIKRRLYERTGVPEYWVVDPELETVKVHRLVDGKYQKAAELSLEDDAVLTTPLLPDLRLPLKQIFELPS
jgi:Uma2 family endonuclease